MTNARLLSLLLFLFCAPVIGLFPFLGFTGSWAIGVAAAVVIAAFAILASRSAAGLADGIRYDILLFSLAVSFALCLLGGEGRLFYANNDWLIRDAVVNDLVSQHWPFVYRIHVPDASDYSFIMRAPLAMYMLPAAIGKIYGIYAAHLMMLMQNTILFALIFYFIVPMHVKFWQGATIISIFVVFSGLDVVPVLVNLMRTGTTPGDHLITPGDHLEPWSGLFQYSSHITQLFWVPNHAIPGWTFVCLHLLWQRGKISVSVPACAFLYIAYWSPFVAIGAAPFVFYAGSLDLIGGKIGRRDVALLSLAAFPALLSGIYLFQGSGTVVRGYEFYAPNFWPIYFVFICVEFIPFVALTVDMRASAGKDPTFLLAVICLLLIPFYSLGVANDFAMRVSIPALAFLAANFAVVLTDNIAERRQLALTSFAGLILLIGSVTGAMEVRRALIRSPLPISQCNFVEAWKQSPFAAMSMASYLGDLNALPEWMRPQSPAGVLPGEMIRCFSQ